MCSCKDAFALQWGSINPVLFLYDLLFLVESLQQPGIRDARDRASLTDCSAGYKQVHQVHTTYDTFLRHRVVGTADCGQSSLRVNWDALP